MSRASRRRLRNVRLREGHYPELGIGGYSRVDATVQFYTRVNALVRPDMVVVDFGAGRGQWHHLDRSETRRRLQTFKGRVAKVVGADVDPEVSKNPTLDEYVIISGNGRIPLESESVDLIVSDWTFEHLPDPAAVAAEFHRVLRSGGWVCARTPNKWGYIGIGARVVPNRFHVLWLSRLQPDRKQVDVFPVRYQLNTVRRIVHHFPDHAWRRTVYPIPTEPVYAGGSWLLWRAFGVLGRIQPRRLDPILCVFLQKA